MRLPLLTVGAVGLAHLVGQLTAPDATFTGATQVLLVPAVAWVLITGIRAAGLSRTPLTTLTLVALFFSWLGDSVPRLLTGDTGFLVMMGFFLLAQLAYVAAFLRYRHRSVAWRRPALATPYLLALVGLLAICHGGAGTLFLPVVVYGVALAAMAVLATGLIPPTALGGLLFLAADGLIALDEFTGLALPGGNGFWVMLGYLTAQLLLALGVLKQARAESSRTPVGFPGGRAPGRNLPQRRGSSDIIWG